MSDLIDRNRLKERLFPGLLELSRGTSKTAIALYKQGWNDAITSIIENEPSAEKKGKWEAIDVYEVVVACSECKQKFTYEHNYCPNCGAKMEVEK